MLRRLNIASRPRRNRKSDSIRSLCAETSLSSKNLIQPLFIHDSPHDEEISSLPGQKRLSINGLLRQAELLLESGVPGIALFPAIKDELKSKDAAECFNSNGFLPKAIDALKSRFPEILLVTDIALDPYSSDGHDGLVSSDGRILNDETVEVLCKQALMQAQAGTDIVAPSDMMDGRVRAIREALDSSGYSEVSIMSYTAKYASACYGPFRGALNSEPKKGDKKTYQMNPANSREALRELKLDEAEGADIVMVKPAGMYLDIIKSFRENSPLPIAAYQVSGEYLMIKSAANTGWLNEESLIMESLISIKRSGADIILSYFSEKAAVLLRK